MSYLIGIRRLPWRLRQMGGEVFWVGTGQVAVVVGSLVGVRLLTEALPPAAYGELALAMTIMTIANQVIMGPLANASLRFFASARELGQVPSFLQAIQSLVSQGTGAMAVLTAIAIVASLLLGRSSWIWLIIPAFLFALASGYGSALDGMQNAARQRVVVSWHSGLGVWLRFLAAVVLVKLFYPSSQIAMVGYLVASVVVLVSQLWFFRRLIHSSLLEQHVIQPSDTHLWMNQMRGYAWPFVTWGVFTSLQVASDRWSLQIFSSTQDVGLYAVLYQVGYYPVALLTTLLAQLVMPILFGRVGDGTDPARISRPHQLNQILTAGTFVFVLFLTGLAFLMHSKFFDLLVSDRYQVVSPLLPLMVLASGLFATGQMATNSLMMRNKTQVLIAPKIGTALFGIAASVAGARWFGIPGVALASVAFGCLYLTWITLLVFAHRIDRPPK